MDCETHWAVRLAGWIGAAVGGAVIENYVHAIRWVLRRGRLMPRPRVTKVQIIRGADDDDQWIKARIELRRLPLIGNDGWAHCFVEAQLEGRDPVPLVISGPDGPLSEASIAPGDVLDVPVAIWLETEDWVYMSPARKFRQVAHEPRIITRGRSQGLIDPTPALSNGPNEITLRIVQHGRVVSQQRFRVHVERGAGFSAPAML